MDHDTDEEDGSGGERNECWRQGCSISLKTPHIVVLPYFLLMHSDPLRRPTADELCKQVPLDWSVVVCLI